ncbi:MAG TPA: GrpB family protein [Candidatus Bathyarchaeia archaeon]|nr:GrpB family protein [Candidatus Bathyarchaeia archaeon]
MAAGLAEPARRVTIVEPKATWPTEFEAIAVSLRQALGSLALRIDHIGSTAVPGLPAKDLIDVQITVAALDRKRLAPALARAGFVDREDIGQDHRPPGATGPDGGWRKLFFQAGSGRPVNVHVRVAGAPNQRYALLFRDYLRTHPESAAAYARLKRALAELGIDPGAYADVKDPACDLIFMAADAWAAQTSWAAR